jgi:uncharacterized membrane protein YfcA
MAENIWLLAALMGLAAALYSSVGHGGASAYLALMALFAVAPETMRPTALVLNVLVAGFGASRFVLAKQMDWATFLPFAVTAIPMAFFAGRVHLPEETYRVLLGAVLLLAAARYVVLPQIDASKVARRPTLAVSLPTGAALGALAGLTGTGGGIFLSPLLVFLGWATPKNSAGIAAAFIVCNSLAGLAGQMSRLAALPVELPILAGAVAIGALIGVSLSIHLFSAKMLLRALGLVLLVAGAKLLLT